MAAVAAESPRPSPDRTLTPEVFGIAAAFVAVELATGGRYGIFRDELYYLACAARLDWGYVDHPPLSIAVLALVRAIAGDGQLALRVVPALLGGCLVLLAGALARELGGGRYARGLAALAVAIVPQYLGICGFYSMNAFDLVIWSAAACLFARLASRDEPRLWIPLGALLGLGLENKVSVLFLGFGLGIATLATPLRRHLARREPWLGLALAIALFAPHLVWQALRGFPTLEFMANAARYKNAPLTAAEFLGAQLLEIHPLNAPLWIGGLAWLLVARDARRFRGLGLVYLAVLGVMLASRAKPYYLGAAYPPLLAAGATALAAATAALGIRWRAGARGLRVAIVGLLVVGGALTAPLAVPALPVERLIAYQASLGLRPQAAERSAQGPLAQHFADRFGWRELTDEVVRVVRELPEADRRELLVVTSNYGEAGALEYYGRGRGLPPIASQHNSYFYWGPGVERVATIVAVGSSAEDLADAWERCDPVGQIVSPYAMPFETADPILVCRGFKLELDVAWRRGKRFI